MLVDAAKEVVKQPDWGRTKKEADAEMRFRSWLMYRLAYYPPPPRETDF